MVFKLFKSIFTETFLRECSVCTVAENVSQVSQAWLPSLMVRKYGLVDSDPEASLPQHYRPALVRIPGTVKHSLRSVPIALLATPEDVCGMARRGGYTGALETDLAIYRIKLKRRPEREAVTLPGFFVLAEGIFHAFER